MISYIKKNFKVVLNLVMLPGTALILEGNLLKTFSQNSRLPFEK
jgi:hypothetical protein